MYTLNMKYSVPGYNKDARIPSFKSESLDKVKKELQKKVLSGIPVSDLTITKEIPFEFKCAVAINKMDLRDPPRPREYTKDDERDA